MTEQYQRDFVDFLVASGALQFGEFTTKSGRTTPYFINTGSFGDGAKISQLGGFYSEHIRRQAFGSVDLIFGPAYKGIPLAVATAAALSRSGAAVGYAFDRKEAKKHGDAGVLVGGQVFDGCRVLIVEDVVTAGTTFKRVVPFLQSLAQVELLGAVIAVDRAERGAAQRSALAEVREELGLKVFPLVTIHEIVEYLSQPNPSGRVLSGSERAAVAAYLAQYGVE